MASSLFQQMVKSLTPQQSNMISQIMAMAKGNPQQAVISLILQQNPQIKNALDTLIQGKDPQAVFYEQCSKMGYDPKEILNKIQQP